MTFVDLNLTYSQQYCDIATGFIIGGMSSLYLLGRILIILLGFYLVYRVTEIFIRRYKIKKNKKKTKWKNKLFI